MNRQLIAGFGLSILAVVPAMAADMRPARAPLYTKAPMMAPLFTWTGCYIGGNGGGLFAKKDWSTAAVPESSVDVSSWLAGGQIGCNYQMGPVVLGVQGDYDWSNANGSAADTTFRPPFVVSDQTTIKSLASVTGRIGYAWDRFLIYGKGGGAWVKDNYGAVSTGGFAASASETRTGWTAGVGGEYAFTDFLTGFVEYDYYDFGTKTNTFAGNFAIGPVDIKQTVSVAKAGLNFKFGGWH